jgi:dTDP-4-dehydrorhamnose reductase
MRRILITGGSGLLGLNWALNDRENYEVVLALHNREVALSNTTSYKASFDSLQNIKHCFEEIKPDLIVHTAGITSVENCEKNPRAAQIVNTDLASNISRVCSELNVRLVHISTDHLFSGDHSMASENTLLSPLNIYAATKAEAEVRVLKNSPHALVIRTNFYGWGPSYRPSFSDYIIDTLREGKELTLFEDVFYTPILAEKLIQNIHELLKIDASGVFNIVGDERVSKYQFGIAIAKYFDLDTNLIKKGKIKDKSTLVKRPFDMSLSNSKACTLIGHKLGSIDQHICRLFDQEKTGYIKEIISL